jgi:hypothetical protein
MKTYKGKFNNKGEILEEFVVAKNEEVAYALLTARLGVTLGKTSYTIRQQFPKDKNNFTIEEVK